MIVIACTEVVLEMAKGKASEDPHAARRQATLCAPQSRLPLVKGRKIEDDRMIYLAVRLAQNSATAGSKFSRPGETDQIWLDPTPHSDEEIQIQSLEENLDDRRVQWYRSPRIAYVLRAS